MIALKWITLETVITVLQIRFTLSWPSISIYLIGKCKGKGGPVLNYLSTTSWRRMGSGGIALQFLTSALDGSEWPASRPGRFIAGEISTPYPLDGRLGGPQSWSGSCGVKRNLGPAGYRTPAARRYTDWTIPTINVLVSVKNWELSCGKTKMLRNIISRCH
jgi:hypothetical protein